jgi:predicted lipoprotein with Yx(FWY)xxD motif
MKRLVAMTAVIVVGVLGLAGCGDDDDDPTVGGDAAEETTTTEAAEEETTTTAGAAAGSEAMISTATTDLGEVVVDSEGYTLYLFTVSEDEGACADQCAQSWPPVVYIEGATASGSADVALIGSAPNGDAEQLTYNGHRLYRFSGDTAPGETNGHGVGDVWFAVDAAGEALPAA